MSSIVIAGDTSGSVTLQAPAVSGTTTLTLPTTSGTLQTSGAGFTTNGVAYASSTSALTTGSALTFNGTSLTNSGNYISSASVGRITKSTTTGRNVFTGGVTGGTTDGAYVLTEGYDYGGTAAGGAIQLVTAGASSPIQFLINGSEQMRLTSTGLGIGTSSPAYKLHAVKTGGGIVGRFDNADGITDVYGYGLEITRSVAYIKGSSELQLGGANGYSDLVIKSSGNVGIGTSSINSQAKLEVAFNQNLSTLGQSRRLILNDLRGGANERTEIGFGYVGTTQPVVIGYQTTDTASNTKGILYFATRDVTTATEPVERARFPTAGGFQVAGSVSVGGVAPTTSGYGITFPATQSASSDANTLDDYEEGSFTPSVSATGVTAYSIRNGKYTKIGQVVVLNIQIQVQTSSGGTGTFAISNAPFTQSGYQATASARESGLGTGFLNSVWMEANSTNIYIEGAQLSASYGYAFTIVYQV
jgi:hypothetical protein